MFYDVKIKSHVRVHPTEFNIDTKEAVLHTLNKKYENFVSKELGYVIGVLGVEEVGEGTIIAGDGAAYYNSKFKLLTWKPEMHEITYGVISEVTNFGAFIDLGVMKGMIHIGQTMEDYVSVSKTNSLSGKASKRSLKSGDLCLARIVAISHKGDFPKIGLTMRQPGLGKLEWIKEDQVKKERIANKTAKMEEKSAKGKGKSGGKK